MPKEPRPSGRKPFPDDEWILGKIAELRRLAEKTEPNEEHDFLRSQPEVKDQVPLGKDSDASAALELASVIFREVASWALNHKIGLAIDEMPAPPGILGTPDGLKPKDEQRREQRVRHERRASDDAREVAGSAYLFNNSRIDRLVLTEIIGNLAPLFPDELAIQAVAALHFLDLGDVLPLLEPQVPDDVNYKRAHAGIVWSLKHYAVVYRDYLLGWGKQREKATKTVADAYHVAIGTIENWGPDVQEELPRLCNIESDKADARRTGEVARQLSRKRDLTELERRFLDSWSNKTLIARGLKYQELRPPKSV